MRRAAAPRNCLLLWHLKCPGEPQQSARKTASFKKGSVRIYHQPSYIFIHLHTGLRVSTVPWSTQCTLPFRSLFKPGASGRQRCASRRIASCSALCSFGYPVAGEAAARRPMYRITKSCRSLPSRRHVIKIWGSLGPEFPNRIIPYNSVSFINVHHNISFFS